LYLWADKALLDHKKAKMFHVKQNLKKSPKQKALKEEKEQYLILRPFKRAKRSARLIGLLRQKDGLEGVKTRIVMRWFSGP